MFLSAWEVSLESLFMVYDQSATVSSCHLRASRPKYLLHTKPNIFLLHLLSANIFSFYPKVKVVSKQHL